MFIGQKINIQKILGLIPENLLGNLSKDTKVDYCAKVLYGQRIFNLLLYGLMTTDRTSQRSLEDLFRSDLFKIMFSYDAGMKVSHSFISARLATIEPEFFRLAFESIYAEFSKLYVPAERLKHRIIFFQSSKSQADIPWVVYCLFSPFLIFSTPHAPSNFYLKSVSAICSCSGFPKSIQIDEVSTNPRIDSVRASLR